MHCTQCGREIRCGEHYRDVGSGYGLPGGTLRPLLCGKADNCRSGMARWITYHCSKACYWRHSPRTASQAQEDLRTLSSCGTCYSASNICRPDLDSALSWQMVEFSELVVRLEAAGRQINANRSYLPSIYPMAYCPV